MTDKQKQSIRDMRRQGMSCGTIAAAHGMAVNTVKSFCRRESINVQSDTEDKKYNLCKNCGIPLMHHPGSKRKTFCNDKCRYTWWGKNRIHKGNTDHQAHLHCGTRSDSDNINHKYCGRECYIHGRCGEGLP